MKVHARDKYHQDHEASAVASFAHHQIHKESDGRWLLLDPDNRAFCWTEIICVAGDGLYVDGDIEPVVFRFGPKHPHARVRWMGTRKHAWDHYFREKACIGVGGRGAEANLRTWKPEIAMDDVEGWIADLIDDTPISELRPETVKTIDALRDNVQSMLHHDDYTRDEVCREVHELEYWEETMHLGMVPSLRMFTAHAALQRLVALLDAREARRREGLRIS